MQIEYSLDFRRTPALASRTQAPADPQGAPPRTSRLLALAHKLDKLVRSGEVSNYGALARLGHISPARLTQILVLLHLSPAIQEYILFLPLADARFISELALRKLAREPDWGRQWPLFEQMLKNGK